MAPRSINAAPVRKMSVPVSRAPDSRLFHPLAHCPSAEQLVVSAARKVVPAIAARRLAASPINSLVDRVLGSCPSAEEVATILRDFPITFDFDADPIRCGQPGALLAIINAYRCMKVINFDVPMPLFNAKNLYDWFRSHGKSGKGYGVHVFSYDDSSHAGDGFANIRKQVVMQPQELAWDNGVGSGMVSLVGLLVHEAAHSVLSKGHNCVDGSVDSSMEYSGAWAAQYWYNRWLAEHSGPALSANQKASMARVAEELRTNSPPGRLSCGKVAPVAKPTPPPPPSTTVSGFDPHVGATESSDTSGGVQWWKWGLVLAAAVGLRYAANVVTRG